MTVNTLNNSGQTRRVAIESNIALYPDISDETLHEVLHYIRSECSALDRATIASNTDISFQYQQLCKDHYIDRLKPVESAIAIAASIALIVGLAALSMLSG